MFKMMYEIKMPYEYHADRKGAKYKIGEAFKNGGEFLESVAKCARGLDYLVNPTTNFDEGSDIESEHASVKSGKASLACLYGESFEEIVAEYFARVASTKWIYMVQIDESVIEYHMNKTEFAEFINEWGAIGIESGSHRKKVRIKATSGKMVAWLEARAR